MHIISIVFFYFLIFLCNIHKKFIILIFYLIKSIIILFIFSFGCANFCWVSLIKSDSEIGTILKSASEIGAMLKSELKIGTVFIYIDSLIGVRTLNPYGLCGASAACSGTPVDT